MATGQRAPKPYHVCSCGESFESTEELLDHGREVHGILLG